MAHPGATAENRGVLSYDKKPGIHALGNTAPDLPPVPGRHASVGCDHEYRRFGTLSLLAGIDLLSGEVLGLVRDRHCSANLWSFCVSLTSIILPERAFAWHWINHSAHISKETRSYLATVPNRFEFVFTPKHGSRLNLVESFFGKLARTLFRGIRVTSKRELRTRIELHLKEVSEEPVVFKWKYRIEELAAESVTS